MTGRDQAYWNGRFEQLEKASHKTAEETMAELEREYRTASREVEREIAVWYQRFADNNGIVNMADARKLLDAGQLKEFRWTVDEYIRHGKENGVSADWRKELENASARFHISRLQALQVEMQNTVEVLFGNQTDALERMMKDTFLGQYYHTAFEVQRGLGFGWDIAGINGSALAKVITTPWATDGRNFSERIWTNKTALINELRTQLSQNLLLGKGPDETIKAISAKFGVSENKTARLVYTESAYIQAVAQGDAYRELGVEHFRFIATLDDRTSDICRSMDGEVFSMKDYQPGATVPPLHPWCRSCTAPYYADLEGIGERAARDPDSGKTYFVPRDMKYKDWEQSFAGGGSKAGLTPVLAGVTISTGIKSCTTVAEVEAYMKKQGWFNPNSSGDQNKKVSLAGCDLEVAQSIASAYEDVFTRYPAMKGKFDAIRAKKFRDDGVYAQCYTLAGGKVEVNKTWFSDRYRLAMQYERDVKNGFHTLNTDWRSIVVHEIGHAVEGTLTNMAITGKLNTGSVRVSTMMRTQVMTACGLQTSDVEKTVSRYATKNSMEWFAECFAEAMCSPTPRPVALEFQKELDVLMKGVK